MPWQYHQEDADGYVIMSMTRAQILNRIERKISPSATTTTNQNSSREKRLPTILYHQDIEHNLKSLPKLQIEFATKKL